MVIYKNKEINIKNIAKRIFNNKIVYQGHRDITHYNVFGNSVQDGIPSPGFPIKINSAGEKEGKLLVQSGDTVTEIQLINPNIFNKDLTAYNDFNPETGIYTCPARLDLGADVSLLTNEVGGSASCDITKLIKVKPDTLYTLNLEDFNRYTETTNYPWSYAFFGQDGALIYSQTVHFIAKQAIFTSPNVAEVYLDIRRTTAGQQFKIKKIELREGLSSPLRSLSTVRDDLDYMRIRRAVFNGSERWEFWTESTTILNVWLNDFDGKKLASTLCKTNRFPVVPTAPNTVGVSFRASGDFDRLYLGIRKADLETPDLAGLKKWLSNNNLEVFYEAATPRAQKIIKPPIPYSGKPLKMLNEVRGRNTIYSRWSCTHIVEACSP